MGISVSWLQGFEGMCLGIPMQVIEAEESYAVCRGRDGNLARIDTMLVGSVQSGQWLMTFLGGAREILNEQQAEQVNSALNALAAVSQGVSDVDVHFADLVGREPQLPDFLRKGGQ